MTVDARAGKPPDPSMLANIQRLMTAYYMRRPDPSIREQRVTFGTSGHRGSAFACAFNEAHILAITQAGYGREYQGCFLLDLGPIGVLPVKLLAWLSDNSREAP